jgi:membrane protease YdiL (CAAX protease family)
MTFPHAKRALFLFGLAWFVPYVIYTAQNFGLWQSEAKLSLGFILTVQIVLGCFVVATLRGLTWQHLGLRRTTGPWFLVAIIALLMSYLFNGALHGIVSPIETTAVQQTTNNAPARSINNYSLGYLLALLIFIAPATAVIEEVAFRGALYGWLRRNLGPMIGILISALIFGFFHLRFINPGGTIGLIATLQVVMGGVILAYLYEKSGSLWPSIYMHSLNNTIGFLQFFVSR